MINIADLESFTSSRIYELLLGHDDNHIAISVPKSSKLFFSERENISYDYIRAAYAGQKLFDVSDFFEYEKVSPELHKSIEFKVICADVKTLANILIELTYLYGINEDPDGNELDQLENIVRFEDEIEKMQIVLACPYLVEIWTRFRQDESDISE